MDLRRVRTEAEGPEEADVGLEEPPGLWGEGRRGLRSQGQPGAAVDDVVRESIPHDEWAASRSRGDVARAVGQEVKRRVGLDDSDTTMTRTRR